MNFPAKASFLVVALVFTCFAQNTPAPTADNSDTRAAAYYNFAMGRLYNELAQAEGNHEDVNKAIQYYQEALKLDPSAHVIFEELTDLYVQTGRLHDAVAQAEELLKTDPNNLDAHRMLARVYTTMAVGNSQTAKVDDDYLHKAINEYQKVTTKDPKDAESFVTLGNLYRAANDSPSAEKAFQSALQADPNSEEALAGLAKLYADLGDNAKAVATLKTLTDKDPNPHTLASLAQQYEEMNDFKSAAEVLKRAVEANPDNEDLSREFAINLAQSGQFESSIKVFQQLAADNPRQVFYALQLSRLYLSQYAKAKKGAPDAQSLLTQAQDWIATAKKIDPTDLRIHDQQANILEIQDKIDAAIAELKSALDEAPRKRNARDASERAVVERHLGMLYRQNKQYDQAVNEFRQLTALGDDSLGPDAWVQIVETYRAANDKPAMLREATAALGKYPDNPAVVEEHASVLAENGKLDEAVAEMRSLLRGGSSDCDIQMFVAQLYETGKRWNDMGKALDAAEKVANSDDQKERISFMRGAMLEREKKFEASEAAFRKVLEINPNDAGALNYLGYMLADRDVRLEEAYDLIKKALDLDPDNGAFLDSLGWVYYRQGKLNEAEGLLQRALDKAQDPTVHDHLGDVYAKQGKTKEAIAQWQASLREFQKSAPADNDPDEVARVNKKLDEAQARLAREMH
jgi:tetratricopeptide (TPR) repeat protein